MIKLSNTQFILLSRAAQNADGNVLPLPDTISAPKPAIEKSIGSLLVCKLIAETEATDDALVWRRDGDRRYSVNITEAGRREAAVSTNAPSHDVSVAPALAKKQSKAALVIALLQRDGGATLGDLVTATNWLPHTTRAALTGLRKKGRAIGRNKRDGMTCYSISRVV